ncbi:hypothetical protein [Neptunitalea lumnitzerae]|uniref:Lipocalin-like domain-containing protein n=1 Tax=Neptunitalea lumnitzerae TaxID=2965509 RepID=A0ABQ5MEK2_9FLAO|nr:hypothetical protein [Neptunitalea sp. Y10]GLB47793.1 hypothetical protein Y10_01610 [Neptunitalea sp. Y10]
MKKITTLLLIILVFISCSNDGEDTLLLDSSSLVGTYEWIVTQGGSGYIYNTPDNSNSTGSLTITSNTVTFIFNGEVTIQGNYHLEVKNSDLLNEAMSAMVLDNGTYYLIDYDENSIILIEDVPNGFSYGYVKLL